MKVCIAVEELKAGMKLAEDVSNRAGMILCRQGTVLTESLIERLKGANVEKVIIEQTMAPEKAKRLFEEKKAIIEKVFSDQKTLSMQLLKNAFLRFWEEKYLKPVGEPENNVSE